MKHLSMLSLCVCMGLHAQTGQAQDMRDAQDILDCVNARTSRGLAEHEDYARIREFYTPPLYYISGPSAKYDTWGFLLDMSKMPALAYETFRPKHDLVTPTFRRAVSRSVSKALKTCDVKWSKKWNGPLPVRADAAPLADTVLAASDR
ncbi:MAG: hypothetical protein AAF340_08000 [Pseudomonadota bacterium]